MIRWGLIAVLLAIFAPTLPLAQPAPVQSGEHARFTRLVATLPEAAVWNVSQNRRTIVLRVADFDSGFDTTGVFRRIPRDRISDVETAPDRLIISLACDCRAAVFTERDRHVVIDVAAADANLPIDFIPRTADLTQPSPAVPAIPRPLPQRLARQTTLDMMGALRRTPLEPAAQIALDDMQQRLTDKVAAATTLGLLDATDPRPPVTADASQGQEAGTRAPPARPPHPLFDNMRVSSSMDPPGRLLAGGRPAAPDGALCTPDHAVALAQWGSGQPAAIAIGAARSRLWNEAGTLNAQAALTLARLYLHLGFGTEAHALLTGLSAPPRPLVALAQILEGRPSVQMPELAAQRHCRGDISLWALLATPLPVRQPGLDPGPPLLALNKLPLHLRRLLAPALSKRFLSNGNANAAAAALRSVERTARPEDLNTPTRLARAKLSLQSGRTALATDGLDALASESSPDSPAALVALVDARLAADQPIAPETAQLVAAYAFEMRKSPLGPDLRRAHVLALLKSGAFDAAFAAADQLGARVEEETAIALRLQLLAELGQNASDIVFLDHMLQQDIRDVARLPRPDQLQVIDRLLSLGFAEKAQFFLRAIPERPRQRDRQLLAARIALALDQPMLARASLIEVTGETAQSLRAQAELVAGNPAEAFRLYQNRPPPQNIQRLSWLSEQSLHQNLETDPVFAPMLSLSGDEIAPPAPGTGMLTASDDLANASAEAREILTTFLLSPDLAVPDPPTR